MNRALSNRRRLAGLAVLSLVALAALAWSSRDDATGATALGPAAPEQSIELELPEAGLHVPATPLSGTSSSTTRAEVSVDRPPIMTSTGELELIVLDARTREPLRGVTVRSVTIGSKIGPQDLRKEAGQWWIGPSPSIAPGPHVPDLDPTARGDSPLRLEVPPDGTLWITAEGHGWANCYVGNRWPARATVLLKPACTLEVVVRGKLEYERIYVNLSQTALDGRVLRRRVHDGVARFDGLPPGSFELEAAAFPGEFQLTETGSTRGDLVHGTPGHALIELQSNRAEIELRLISPATTETTQSVGMVWVRGPVPPAGRHGERHRQRVSNFTAETLSDGAVVYSPNSPITVPAGRQWFTVMPHGVRFQRDVEAGTRTVIEIELPALVPRTITVWDIKNNKPLQGSLTVVDAYPERRNRGTDSRAGPDVYDRAMIDEQTGKAEMLLPDTPFRLMTTPGGTWLRPGEQVWITGSAVPEDLRIDLRPFPPRPLGGRRPPSRGGSGG